MMDLIWVLSEDKLKKNDLPEISKVINEYCNNQRIGLIDDHPSLNYVLKSEILESYDIGLNYDAYIKKEINTKYDIVELGDYTSLMTGGTPSTKDKRNYENGTIKWLVSGDIHKGIISDCDGRITKKGLESANTKYLPLGSVLIALNGQGKTRGTVAILNTKAVCNQSLVSINPNDPEILNNRYLYYVLKSRYKDIRMITGDKNRRGLNMILIRKIKIPLPPIEIQKEIVEELEQYQKVIDGAKLVVDNYKPNFQIDESWQKIEIEKVCELNPKKSEVKDLDELTVVSFCPMECININNEEFIPTENKQLKEVYKGYTYFKNGDVILAKVTPCFENGKIGIASNLTNGIGFGSTEFYVFRANNLVLNKWIFLNLMNSNFIEHGINNFTGTSGLRRVPKN